MLINEETPQEKLKEELIIKENMINSIKNELNTKNQIYEEINRMKNEMENYLQTMDKLYHLLTLFLHIIYPLFVNKFPFRFS